MTIRVGILGMGFMGRTHLRAFAAAAKDGLPCRVAALANSGPFEAQGRVAARGNLEATEDGPLFDPNTVHQYTDAQSLAANPDIDLVSICTPTDTHVDYARQMLRAGKHVLLEKPVSLRAQDARVLALEADNAGRTCMPAMCMRFWPGWDWLAARVRDHSLGAVKSASFTRMGSRPAWAPEFYRNPARCGGAMFDLHIHDADIVHWLFGRPHAVASVGTIDRITTLYQFASASGPAHVVAEGGWLEQAGFPFRMRYTVEFESAVADWDITRGQPLMLTKDGTTAPVTLPPGTGYDGEVRALIRQLAGLGGPALPTLAEAATVLDTLAAERRSLDSGSPERCFEH
jgi:predicted dehydrogenase